MDSPKCYRACRRTVFWFYLFAFGLEALFKSILRTISGYVAQNILIIADMTFSSLLILSVIVFPIYVVAAKFEVSSKEVKLRKGFILISHQFVPLHSVSSVTTVTTPLSFFTGFNFVVLNSPGSKSIMPFVTRRQAREVSDIVNEAIRRRVGSVGGDSE